MCHAGCLPRKELYKAWEMARRVRRVFRGGRIVDLAAGHGLLAHILLILDNSSPQALSVDTTRPPSSSRLHDVLVDAWPRLAGRVVFDEVRSSQSRCPRMTWSYPRMPAERSQILSSIVHRPFAPGSRCFRAATIWRSMTSGSLSGWVDGPLAVDVMRAVRLEQKGYRVRTQTIPRAITPKNRLLLGEPD